jgi:hypothetical protein
MSWPCAAAFRFDELHARQEQAPGHQRFELD